MPKFNVTVSHTIETTVQVDARDANAARHMVDKRSFPLPSRDEWSGLKDWRYSVAEDEDDTEIATSTETPGEADEMEELVHAVVDAQQGDSNDVEIDAYRDALSHALIQHYPQLAELI